MDPLTHALTGAAIASVAAGSRLGRRALIAGAAAALLPDLDVLIRSATDPLLAIEHHRGFTHSLLFVPVGGALTGLIAGRRGARAPAMLAGVLAWLSHALLDAATTYGTQLFWPFSSYRVGLDIISIIDPLFTLIVLSAVIGAFFGSHRLVSLALILAVLWLALGFVQRERASAVQGVLASSRGDQPVRSAVFPTFGNTIVWRSIYQVGHSLRIDRIRVPWLASGTYAAVTTVPLVSAEAVGSDAKVRRDFDRFAWFSDGWVAAAPTDRSIFGDARYSLHTDRYEPVWGIRFHPEASPRTEWVNRTRDRKVDIRGLWEEVRGDDRAFRTP